MKDKIYTIYSDPRHGWVAVKIAELIELGIAEKITKYSYMRGETAYLEEDQDLSTFFNAYQAKYNEKPRYVQKLTDKSSSIRFYDSYSYEVKNEIQ
jgi:hypothetical protein